MTTGDTRVQIALGDVVGHGVAAALLMATARAVLRSRWRECDPPAALLAFALSIDDFVISAFLQGDASSATIPVRLYSAARLAPNPSLNALASILLFASLLAIFLAIAVIGRSRKRQGAPGSSVEDFARLEL